MEPSPTLKNPLLSESFYENDNNNDDDYMFDENGNYTGMFIAKKESALDKTKRYGKNLGKAAINELILKPIPYNFFEKKPKVPLIPIATGHATAFMGLAKNQIRKQGKLEPIYQKPSSGYLAYENKPYNYKLPKNLDATYLKIKTESGRDQFLKDLIKYFAYNLCSYESRTEDCAKVIQFFKENALHRIPKYRYDQIVKEGIEEGMYYLDDENNVRQTKSKPENFVETKPVENATMEDSPMKDSPIEEVSSEEAPNDESLENATQTAGKSNLIKKRTRKARRARKARKTRRRTRKTR